MERTRLSTENIRWKKIGGGVFIFNGRHIKPGQVFLAREQDIPKAFRDVCIPLDAIPVNKQVEDTVEVVPVLYKVQPRGKSKTWFDVISPSGKVINEKALKREDADKLAHDLSKEK